VRGGEEARDSEVAESLHGTREIKNKTVKMMCKEPGLWGKQKGTGKEWVASKGIA